MQMATRKRKTPHELCRTLAINLVMLMDVAYPDRVSKARALASDAKVGLATVQRTLACDTGATIDNVAAYAAALDVLPWQLLVEGLDPVDIPMIAVGPQAKADAKAFEEVRSALRIVKNRYSTPNPSPGAIADPPCSAVHAAPFSTRLIAGATVSLFCFNSSSSYVRICSIRRIRSRRAIASFRMMF